MKTIILFLMFVVVSGSYAKDVVLPTANELIALQKEQESAQTDGAKPKSVDGKLVKINAPKLYDKLVYVADEKRKNFIALSPLSLVHTGSNMISWEETKKMNMMSFKSFSAKNKSSFLTIVADTKKEGKKTVFVVSQKELESVKSTNPQLTIVAIDKKNKLPIDGEIKLQ